jgi:hypothetical protein
MNRRVHGYLRSWLRPLNPRRGALRRPVDRVESAAWLAALIIALASVPCALTVGSVVHGHELAVSSAQSADRTPATAMLSEKVPLCQQHGDPPTTVLAGARWRSASGAVRTGWIAAPPGSLAGQRIPIWIDRSGRPVGSPLTPDQAQWQGAMAVVDTLAAVVALLATALILVRRQLDRTRMAAWEAEWHQVEPGWTERAG